jgi:hypothetical protein
LLRTGIRQLPNYIPLCSKCQELKVVGLHKVSLTVGCLVEKLPDNIKS